MHQWHSLSHVKWECKHHIVIVPKYRRRAFFGKLRGQIGRILRELCEHKGVELVEGHAMPDHVHLCLAIPPKYSVAFTIGFLKGKSSIRIHRQYVKDRKARYGAGASGLVVIVSVRWVWMTSRSAATSANRKSSTAGRTCWILINL